MKDFAVTLTPAAQNPSPGVSGPSPWPMLGVRVSVSVQGPSANGLAVAPPAA